MAKEETSQTENDHVESPTQDELPVLTPPTARQVIGRIISTNFAYFMAGMNGTVQLT